jgi:polar amino acid transport system substrate-binding protein
VADGRFDAGVAALTISSAREAVLDFSQPYYTTGLGIAVPASHPGWWAIIHSIFSLGFIQVVLVLAAVLLDAGLLVWVFERRRNHDFAGGPIKGIGTGFWWAAVTMTGVGYGDKVPSTVAGRLLAVAWMFTSVIVISTLIAGITSALTTSRLTGLVHNVSDLDRVRVGAVAHTTTTDYLSARQIPFIDYSDPAAALTALRDHRIDAVVYDRPLLAWLIRQRFAGTLQVLPLTFDKQTYGIALPAGSPLRETVDRALLDDVHSDWWQHLLFSYFGREAQ